MDGIILFALGVIIGLLVNPERDATKKGVDLLVELQKGFPLGQKTQFIEPVDLTEKFLNAETLKEILE